LIHKSTNLCEIEPNLNELVGLYSRGPLVSVYAYDRSDVHGPLKALVDLIYAHGCYGEALMNTTFISQTLWSDAFVAKVCEFRALSFPVFI
jgi:hypothetical protein